jgi:hypothetical protein
LTEEEIASVDAINKNVPYYVSTEEALAGYLAYAPDFDGQE